jgi:hypothetical protein
VGHRPNMVCFCGRSKSGNFGRCNVSDNPLIQQGKLPSNVLVVDGIIAVATNKQIDPNHPKVIAPSDKSVSFHRFAIKHPPLQKAEKKDGGSLASKKTNIRKTNFYGFAASCQAVPKVAFAPFCSGRNQLGHNRNPNVWTFCRGRSVGRPAGRSKKALEQLLGQPGNLLQNYKNWFLWFSFSCSGESRRLFFFQLFRRVVVRSQNDTMRRFCRTSR